MNPTQEPPDARGAPARQGASLRGKTVFIIGAVGEAVDSMGRLDILVNTELTVLPMRETSWP